MSSEESEDDSIIVHPIPWRSAYVSRMFAKIDAYTINKKSSQAKRQMKSRVVGRPSTRPRLTSPDVPDWALAPDSSLAKLFMNYN